MKLEIGKIKLFMSTFFKANTVGKIIVIILIGDEEFSLRLEDFEAMVEATRITKINGMTTINGKETQLE